jgi:hypothetical protein
MSDIENTMSLDLVKKEEFIRDLKIVISENNFSSFFSDIIKIIKYDLLNGHFSYKKNSMNPHNCYDESDDESEDELKSMSILDFAVFYGSIEIILFLIKNGANFYFITHNESPPSDYIEKFINFVDIDSNKNSLIQILTFMCENKCYGVYPEQDKIIMNKMLLDARDERLDINIDFAQVLLKYTQNKQLICYNKTFILNELVNMHFELFEDKFTIDDCIKISCLDKNEIKKILKKQFGWRKNYLLKIVKMFKIFRILIKKCSEEDQDKIKKISNIDITNILIPNINSKLFQIYSRFVELYKRIGYLLKKYHKNYVPIIRLLLENNMPFEYTNSNYIKSQPKLNKLLCEYKIFYYNIIKNKVKLCDDVCNFIYEFFVSI